MKKNHPVDHESAAKPEMARGAKAPFEGPHKNGLLKKRHKGNRSRPSTLPDGESGLHARIAADYRNRFWLSLAVTLMILILSPVLHTLVGTESFARFHGYGYILFGLGSVVFWYGAWPFHKGLFAELKSLRPEMMTFISLIMGSAYIYISSLVFLSGKMLFLELAVLIDALLLGHWIHVNRKAVPR